MPKGYLQRSLMLLAVTAGVALTCARSMFMTGETAAAQDQPKAAPLAAPLAPPTTRPVVYIASPYSKGDPAINTHFQCRIFDQLMNEGVVWPVAPLWSHFQHTLFPRPYKDWVGYDLALIPRYDACLRLNAEDPKTQYRETQSSGADNEVVEFKRLGKPVFYSIDDLYAWAKSAPPATPARRAGDRGASQTK